MLLSVRSLWLRLPCMKMQEKATTRTSRFRRSNRAKEQALLACSVFFFLPALLIR